MRPPQITSERQAVAELLVEPQLMGRREYARVAVDEHAVVNIV